MHRSGTSALTGTLGKLGVGLPKNLLDADENNPTGHWEPAPLVELNDRILTAAGSSWDDWRQFDLSTLDHDKLQRFKKEIAGLIDQEFADEDLFVIKDPRICRMIPLYEEILVSLKIEMRYLLIHRNPLAVIASHRRRDKMTHGFGEFMWLRHVLDAEAATRKKPRAAISYESFIEDWRKAAAQIAEQIKLEWPCSIQDAGTEIDELISPDLKHHAPTLEELAGDSTVSDWVKDTYSALQMFGENGNSRKAATILDRVKKEFDTGAESFGRASLPELKAREAQLTGLADIRQSLIDTANIEVTRLHGLVDIRQSEVERLDSEVERLDKDLRTIKNSLPWRITAPLRSIIRRWKAFRQK